MRYGDIDIDELIIEALAEGRLVIFAGAGVSRDRPSRYPDFKLLAQEAGRAFAFDDRRFSPFDQFFGRLERATPGRVHEWVRGRLDDHDSRPNAHHHSLLQLFGRASRVRVVTTNFDKHFSTAAAGIYPGECIEEYCAPALPVGSRFSGLVYLHGSVAGPAERLVLTDADFGRAYLTEGWACRFLLELFRQYTVLFVGYSAQDTVVQYLARGLPPDGTRVFAFASSAGEQAAWAALHVKPIDFRRTPRRCYAGLWQSLDRLAEDVHRCALDQEARAREILRGTPPPSATEENDFLLSLCRSPDRIAFFIRHANSLPWVDWAEREGLLSPLFSPYTPASPLILRLADWLAWVSGKVSRDFLIKLLAQHGGQMSPALWGALGDDLATHGDFSLPEPRALLSLLLAAAPLPLARDTYFFNELVQTLPAGTSPDLCLILFSFLSTPRHSPKQRSWPGDTGAIVESVDHEVLFPAARDALATLWTRVMKPAMECYAEPVALMAEGVLSQHRRHVNITRTKTAYWDDITVSRPDIATPPQLAANEPLHALITVTVECVEWLGEHAPAIAGPLIARWKVSSVPALRKLAVHAMAGFPGAPAEQVLAEVLERQWLLDPVLHCELDRLLGKAYPLASPEARARFLDEARQMFDDAGRQPHAREGISDWMMFNLLSHLASPGGGGCTLAAQRLPPLQALHPNWRYEPPRRTAIQTVDFGALGTPATCAELLAAPPDAKLDLLLTYRDEPVHYDKPPRSHLCAAVREAVERQPRWGITLGGLLMARNDVPDDLWHAIVNGFRRPVLESDEWSVVLDLFRQANLPASVLSQVAGFLLGRLETAEGRLPAQHFPAVLSLCRRLWDLDTSSLKEIERTRNGRMDWPGTAINNVGGITMQCALALALQLRHAAPSEWHGLPADLGSFMDLPFEVTGLKATCGRVVLAGAVAHCFCLDADWTRANVLPLFDWSSGDGMQALQAWEGHTILGGVVGDALPILLTIYNEGIPHWERLRDDPLRGATGRMVGMLSWSRIEERSRASLLCAMETSSGPRTRTAFAESIGWLLEAATPEDRQRFWTCWIGDYFTARVQSLAPPVDAAEVKAMLEWAPDVPDFHVFVSRILSINVSFVTDGWMTFYRLNKNGRVKEYPADALALANWCLAHVAATRSITALENLAEELAALPSPPVNLRGFLDALCARGSPRALRLADRLGRP